MLRFLIFLVGMLATNRPGGMRTAPLRPDESYGRATPRDPHRGDGDTWYLPPQPQPPRRPSREPGTMRAGPPGVSRASSSGRRCWSWPA